MKCWILVLGCWKASGEQREWRVFLCTENDMDKWTPIWLKVDLFPKYLRHIFLPFPLSSSALQIWSTYWFLFFHKMWKKCIQILAPNFLLRTVDCTEHTMAVCSIGSTIKILKCEVLVIQLCLTLCNPMDCSLPGSFVHRILQARMLEWVAVSFSRGSSWLRDQTRISCFFRIGRLILHHLSHQRRP